MVRILWGHVFLSVLLVLTPLPLGAQAATGTTVLRAGDAVRITVWGHEDLSGEFPITGDGHIAHPIYRELQVAGQPRAEVERLVGDLLRRFETSPQFVVQPLLRVVVGGEVRQPNLYLLPPEMTVAQAVGLAGGVTDRGRLDRIRLVRGTQEQRIDLTAPVSEGAELTVHSGDRITVDRRVSIFREYIAPAGSITAALAAIVSLIIRN